MADTTYLNLNLTGPEVNSSDGTWGGKLNTNFQTIDAQFAPSGAGTVVRKDSGGNAFPIQGLWINGPARLIHITAGASPIGAGLRWQFGADGVAESGGNAGSNFIVASCADDGTTVIDIPLSIARSSGVAAFSHVPTAAGSPVVTQATAGAFAPVIGAIQMFAGSGDPTNWMVCDGRAISRSTYNALFGVIGTFYGVGDGTSTFNIPNMAERAPIGRSPNPPALVPFNTNTVGTVFGEGVHTLTTTELPSHQHTVPNPPHTHAFTWQKVSDVQTTSPGGIRVTDINATADSQTATTQPDTTGTLTSNLTGGGGVHNNVQPSIVLNFIIRVQ